MPQYSEYLHKTCSTDLHSHSQKKQALLLFLYYFYQVIDNNYNYNNIIKRLYYNYSMPIMYTFEVGVWSGVRTILSSKLKCLFSCSLPLLLNVRIIHV